MSSSMYWKLPVVNSSYKSKQGIMRMTNLRKRQLVSIWNEVLRGKLNSAPPTKTCDHIERPSCSRQRLKYTVCPDSMQQLWIKLILSTVRCKYREKARSREKLYGGSKVHGLMMVQEKQEQRSAAACSWQRTPLTPFCFNTTVPK